jgi:hypothetical protein
MCPFFSAEALRAAVFTFDLSYSTWGLDYLWPKLPGLDPVVVDAFNIKHVRPMESHGPFYEYMKKIGISPRDEATKLREMVAGAADSQKVLSESHNTTNLKTGTSQ